MAAVETDASDGKETGRTASTIKEMRQGEADLAKYYLIRPHIAVSPATIQDAKMV